MAWISLPGVKRTARSLVTLGVVISFLFVAFLGSAAVSNPAASSAGVVCQIESVVNHNVAGHGDCEPSGPSANCSFHSTCVSIAVPTAGGLVASPVSAHWPSSATDDPVGQGPSVGTPPPISFA